MTIGSCIDSSTTKHNWYYRTKEGGCECARCGAIMSEEEYQNEWDEWVRFMTKNVAMEEKPKK